MILRALERHWRVLTAANDLALLAQHSHKRWVMKDTVSCARCRAEAVLLDAARVRLGAGAR